MDTPEFRARLRAGAAGAFDQVYAHFHPPLYRYLARLSLDVSLAEELLQEVWLRFADRAHTLPDEIELGAWLFTVARNLYLSQRRREAVRRRWLRATPADASASGSQASPFEALCSSRAQLELEAGLAALPEHQREILILVAIEQLSPSQAARILEIEPAAARKRLMRARQLLAEHLQHERAPRSAKEVT